MEIFSREERRSLERLVIPMAVFEIGDAKNELILITSGLKRFFKRAHADSALLVADFNEHPDHYLEKKTQIRLKQEVTQSFMRSDHGFKEVISLKISDDKESFVSVNGDFDYAHGHLLLFVHLADMTSQQQMITSAIQTRDHLSMLLDKILYTTQTCIFWKDTQRRFLGANKAFLDYYGFKSLNAILGKTDEDMGWHVNPGPYKSDEERIIQNGESTYRVHGTCIAKGRVRDIVASKSPLYLNGSIVGLVGSFEDVTQQYQQRDEINKLTQALVKSLRNEEKANAAKADFMARMSHDMRTPLTTVIGLSEQAIEQADEQNKKIYSQIGDASKYLLSLLNDILDVEKFDSGRMQRYDAVVDINKLYLQVKNMMTPQAEKKHQTFSVKNDPLPHDHYIRTDERWLCQILINIINNAIKYTPDGGTITWETKYAPLSDGRVMAHYTISDNGVGMTKDFLKHMYEPFSQEMNSLSHSETSTGLGLSIVKNAVALFGGEIECQSVLNKGTTFTLSIPLDYPEKEELQAFKQKRSSRSSDFEVFKNKKILLCEDVLINAGIIQNILSRYGMTSDHATNGLEGLEMAKKNHYDAILMDIRMPGMDGLTAAREIRKFDQNIPIIALSANTYKEDVDKSLAAGMNAHIGKPINVRELMDALYTFLS